MTRANRAARIARPAPASPPPSPRIRRTRRPFGPAVPILLAAAVLLLGACGGPERPFELGLKEVPSDLLLGRQTQPTTPLPAQLPPAMFLVGDLAGLLPPAARPAPPPPLPEPPPPPAPCPESDPLAAAKVETTVDIAAPPVPSTYTFRTSGTLLDPLGPRPLPATATREVGAAQYVAPAEFVFPVTVDQGGRRTTTTYHVVPRTSLVVPPGLYISGVDSGEAVPFQPKPELLLLPFPALPGTTFNTAGSDGATTVQYDGRVEETERINACGVPVDGIRVALTNGRATSGRVEEGSRLAEVFNATYTIATQYGGISIRDYFKGEMPGAGLAARELFATINSEPRI
jgi:hypothetical protein